MADVKFSKIKLLPHGGIKASMQITKAVDGDISVIDREEINNETPHPDFMNAMRSLAEDLRSVFEWPEEMLEKIEVRGIAISGAGDKQAVVITGLYETRAGLRVAINSPRIVLSGEAWGFEFSLADEIAAVEAEARAYFFDGKKAQLSLFGEPSPEDEAAAEE